ncbi:hypothetical protein K458DRAFT_152573 [Lentithecium fluviatile CBS 122367]|uniref:Uncharacterized protein n=1 Tax=Lentithecium fluviatile CBS 122367 TaxID=1168545 RepID=A0A6G1JDX5_9PLEO|nr:hypothetical protein K458DRAFT_152573 [Lentithecium fluviatile CBS 122367]
MMNLSATPTFSSQSERTTHPTSVPKPHAVRHQFFLDDRTDAGHSKCLRLLNFAVQHLLSRTFEMRGESRADLTAPVIFRLDIRPDIMGLGVGDLEGVADPPGEEVRCTCGGIDTLSAGPLGLGFVVGLRAVVATFEGSTILLKLLLGLGWSSTTKSYRRRLRSRRFFLSSCALLAYISSRLGGES